MKKRFLFEFEDEGPRNVTWEAETGDRLGVEVHDGLVMVSANHGGYRALARLCARLADGRHEEGFHVHLPEDFEPGAPDVLTLGIIK
jgi:hypothetical protein